MRVRRSTRVVVYGCQRRCRLQTRELGGYVPCIVKLDSDQRKDALHRDTDSLVVYRVVEERHVVLWGQCGICCCVLVYNTPGLYHTTQLSKWMLTRNQVASETAALGWNWDIIHS